LDGGRLRLPTNITMLASWKKVVYEKRFDEV